MFKKNIFLILAVIFLILSVLFERFFFNEDVRKADILKFKKELIHSEKQLISWNDKISRDLEQKSVDSVFSENISLFKKLKEKEGFLFFIYKNDSLVIWSDNNLQIEDINPDLKSNTIRFIPNAWVYVKSKK